jgi:MtrB/PioB family decaheme-associated outer membrane protein
MLKPNAFCLPLLLSALFGLLPQETGAQVDTSAWVCEFCPFEDGYRASYEAGASAVNDDAARFGNATGRDEQGAYIDLNGSGRYARDGYRLDWTLEDLGLDSRRAAVEGRRPGSYGFYLDYRELPYRRFDTTQTVFEAATSGSLSLPQSWVAAGTTSGFTALDASLRRRDVESDRKTVGIGAHWLPGARYRVFADYNRQVRDGIDLTSGAGFTQSSMLPRSFDFQTDRADLGLQYSTPRSSWTVAYYGSFFSSRDAALSWQTPFTTGPGAEILQMSQEPDNRFQQLSFSGHFRPGVWDSVLAFSAATGRGEQSDALLPYTSNPNIAAAALPGSSIDGKVGTGNYAFTATARPTSRSRLKLAYRYDERDNRTQVSEWSRVIVDLFDSGESEQNMPYGFERLRLDLSGELQLLDDLRISAGYARKETDRDFQEVAEQTETTGWGQARWRPTSWLDARGRAGTSKRDIDRYDTTVAVSVGQNPLLRKYNLAYRFREFGEVTLSASVPEKPISMSATVFAANDSYTKSPLGMTASDELRYTLDLSWALSPNISTYLMIGSEEMEAEQAGSERGASADWRADHEDSFDHLGAGLHWQQESGKLDLRFDYTRGDGNTRVLMSSDSGGDGSLPDIRSRLNSAQAEAVYRWSERLAVTLNLRFESFRADDWALQDVEPDTIPTVLSLGADPYDYEVWMIGIGFRYSIGADKDAGRQSTPSE